MLSRKYDTLLKVFHWIVSYLHLSSLLLDRISLGLEIIWRHAMITDNKHFGWSGSTLFTYFTFISQFSNSKLPKCQAIIEWHPFAQLRTSAWWPLDSPKLLCSLVEFMSYHLHILSECMFSVARLTLCVLEIPLMPDFSIFVHKLWGLFIIWSTVKLQVEIHIVYKHPQNFEKKQFYIPK